MGPPHAALIEGCRPAARRTSAARGRERERRRGDGQWPTQDPEESRQTCLNGHRPPASNNRRGRLFGRAAPAGGGGTGHRIHSGRAYNKAVPRARREKAERVSLALSPLMRGSERPPGNFGDQAILKQPGLCVMSSFWAEAGGSSTPSPLF